MAPDVHATLSASGAHRWMECPPSALIEAALPERETPAAAEGTLAHALAEAKLRAALGQAEGGQVELPLPEDGDAAAEMELHTSAYARYVMEQVGKVENPTVLVEQRVDFSPWVPGGFGTCDCLIIADGVLRIIDLKYGQGVLVEAQGNPQLRLYALGALNEFGPIYDVTEVVATIYQPRRGHIDTERISAADLVEWAETVVKPAAEMAAKGEGRKHPGEWCQFCKIKATCAARAVESLKVAAYYGRDFGTLTDREISEALLLGRDMTAWVKDLEAWTLAEATAGHAFPGLKLVEGRATRRLTDPEAACRIAEAEGYDAWETRPVTLTRLEKQMGKKRFAELLGEFVTKTAGAPALVAATDPREAWEPVKAETVFKPIEN